MNQSMHQPIPLDIDSVKEKLNIFIATPMYGGMCHGLYTKSMIETISDFSNFGIKSRLYYLFNESLIPRARNYCVAEFLKSDCTHLWFVDSDISWRAVDLIYMLNWLVKKPDMHIFSALYPKKTIAWEKVLQAANSGEFDEKPSDLQYMGGDMVFNPDKKEYPNSQIPMYEPAVVKEAGTGFMLISREVFDTYANKYPEKWYELDQPRSESLNIDDKICAFFDCGINDEKRYLSEDYMFCQDVRKLGYKIWTLPFINLKHSGSYVFHGDLQTMSKFNISQ